MNWLWMLLALPLLCLTAGFVFCLLALRRRPRRRNKTAPIDKSSQGNANACAVESACGNADAYSVEPTRENATMRKSACENEAACAVEPARETATMRKSSHGNANACAVEPARENAAARIPPRENEAACADEAATTRKSSQEIKPARRSKGPASFRMAREWLKSMPQEDVFLQSRDGLRLRARLIVNGDGRRFAILCHGYRAHSASMAAFARGFYARGYSLLLPDARAHGESEGKWIGMGWLERWDLLDWVELVNRRFDAPSIVLMGVSMGGATVMNAAGEALPANVRCLIEDCGFCSLRDEFIWQLRKFYRLPAWLFLLSAAPICRLLAGYSPLTDGDGCAQLSRCTRPILFLHGGADRFVPPEMLERAYAAAPEPKRKQRIEGAEHADSIAADPAAYWRCIDGFLEKYAHS